MLKLEFSTLPTLETKQLVLRELTDGDVPALHRLRSDEEAMRYICRPLTTCEEDARALISEFGRWQSDGTGITWCMSFREDRDTLIGIIGLYRIKKEHDRGEVGYTLSTDHWGRGLMSEALKCLVQFSFEQLGFHSLEAHTSPDNGNSKRLLDRNGFRLAGSFRDCLLFEGSYYSLDVFELLKSDWLVE